MAEKKILTDLYVQGKLKIAYPSIQANFNNDFLLIHDPFTNEIKQLLGSALVYEGGLSGKNFCRLNQRLIGVVDGVNQTFITPHTGVFLQRDNGELKHFTVYLNGQRLHENEDFTVSQNPLGSYVVVTFLVPPDADGFEDVLTADYFTWDI